MILVVVIVLYLLTIPEATGNVHATEGDTVSLQCNTSAMEPVAPVDWKIRTRTQSGSVIDDYIFMYNGVQNDDYKPRFALSSTTLIINNASTNDSGIYFCVEDSGIGVINTITLSVYAHNAMSAVQPPNTDSPEVTTPAKQGASPAWEIIITLIVILLLAVAAYVGVKLWKRWKSPTLRRFELKSLLPSQDNASPLTVDVTTTELCCVFGDMCGRKRAKMPCGHVISAEALQYKCISEVNLHRLWQFKCPMCPFVWDFAIIRHVLRTVMKSAKLNKIAVKMSENFLQQRDRFRECPRCGSVCERNPDEAGTCSIADKVVCVVCTVKNNGRPVEFCWRCLRPWASTDRAAAGSPCGNPDCSVDEVSPETVAAFPDQRMGNVPSAPGIRACPGCRFFVSLAADGYKHVKCAACKLEFCMVCLKGKDEEGRWQCSECDGPCEPAPHQPELLSRLTDVLNLSTQQPNAANAS